VRLRPVEPEPAMDRYCDCLIAASCIDVEKEQLATLHRSSWRNVLLQYRKRAVCAHPFDDRGMVRPLLVIRLRIDLCRRRGFYRSVVAVIPELDDVARPQLSQRYRSAPHIVSIIGHRTEVRGALRPGIAQRPIDQVKTFTMAHALADSGTRKGDDLIA